MTAQTEDVASGFVAIITLILNLIPTVTNTPGLVSPQIDAALISLALILKTTLGYIPLTTAPAPSNVVGGYGDGPAQAPPVSEAGIYNFTASNSTGGSFTGSFTVTTSKAAAALYLTNKYGYTNIVWGEKWPNPAGP